MKTKFITVILLTTIYTIIRYVVFGNVELIQVPTYLLNKSISMASTIFLLFASISYEKGKMKKLKYWGSLSWYFAILHVLLSLSILSSAYYPKFFGLEKMNLIGELTIMFGVMAMFSFWILRNGKKVFGSRLLLRAIVGLLITAHLFVMGFTGWINISKWHGGLPPISLLSFITIILSVLFFLWSWISKNKQD